MARPVVLFWCVAAAVLAVHLAADPASEPSFYNDESRHVMTGVFVRDALADSSASAADPKGYALRYYAQYPALGLLTWPPLFHAVEGVCMLAFGTSFLVPRVLVGLFALLGGWYAFRLVARTHGLWAAAFVVAAVGFSPMVFEYNRRVMLEVPALALVLAAVFHFERYLDNERPRDAVLACVFSALAALTRYDGVVLLPLFVFRLVVRGKLKLLYRRPVVAGIALALALTVPYYLFAWHTYSTGITHLTAKDSSSFLTPAHFLYYPAALPAQVGWPIVAAAVVGIVAACVNRTRPTGAYVGLCVVTYAFFAPMAELDPRHTIYWIPAVAVFAAEGVMAAARLRPALGVAVALALIGVTAWDAVTRPAWSLAGYEETAAYVVEHASGERPVLMDGMLNGTFIYHTRRADPERGLWVLRGDKLLYSVFCDANTGHTEYVSTEADVLVVLERYDPELIVVEQPAGDNVRAAGLLRDALRDHPELFRLEHTTHLRASRDNRFEGARLEVYRKLGRNPHPASAVELPVFGLGGSVKVER